MLAPVLHDVLCRRRRGPLFSKFEPFRDATRVDLVQTHRQDLAKLLGMRNTRDEALRQRVRRCKPYGGWTDEIRRSPRGHSIATGYYRPRRIEATPKLALHIRAI